jgi:hypothetical protein
MHARQGPQPAVLQKSIASQEGSVGNQRCNPLGEIDLRILRTAGKAILNHRLVLLRLERTRSIDQPSAGL